MALVLASLMPLLAAQLGIPGAGQAAQPVEFGDDAQGLADGIFAGDAAAQQDCHQLRIVEVAGAVFPQPFPGPLARRQLPDGGLVRNGRRRRGRLGRGGVIIAGAGADNAGAGRFRAAVQAGHIAGQDAGQFGLKILQSGHFGRRAGKYHGTILLGTYGMLAGSIVRRQGLRYGDWS